MDFNEAERYLLSFTDYEKIPGIAYTAENYDLRRMEQLLKPLGNPHLAAKTVHLAGTKGKGSTAAMIASILSSAHYRTGMYTSPHLHTIRERARINGEMITENEFAAIVTHIKPIVEKLQRKANFGQLTTFEILTAVAFTFFYRHGVQFQVLEVGLGGRLDATNIARGDVCVITSISLDHMEILGDAVVKIAAEKVGIIKTGSVVINFPQTDAVNLIIQEACKEQKAVLIQVGKDITWERIRGNMDAQRLVLRSKRDEYSINLPLLGDFQLENAAGAVATVEALIKGGAQIKKQDIVEGIGRVSWPGRLQVLSRRPYIVVDGAHNAHSMQRLIESVKKYFNFRKCSVVFGSSLDKDIDGMARELSALTQDIIVTTSSHPRAARKSAVIQSFQHHGVAVKEGGTVGEAISAALNGSQKDDLILVTGSLFIVAEAIRYIQKG
ncbi:MAG: bifunctional folylpolyglutamate synthase/dihydrofolate synthase [Deltaproteobacteria bacterium]|nr:bifunctional folylpolyglutamate synthase/dihydrofolate synthase [Deltaproteobacteria bacterium]